MVMMRSARRVEAAQSFGAEVRRLRESRRLTQDELADLAGVSQQYISDTERGIRRPEVERIDAIAEALRVPAYSLRALAGHSGMDGAAVDNGEAELVAAYRGADDAQREQVLRVVKALLGG
jgi:transcriptional regulator with XRE-family HTH domain